MRWTGNPSSFSHRCTVRVVLCRRPAMLFQPSSLSRTAGVTFLQGFQYMKFCDIASMSTNYACPKPWCRASLDIRYFGDAEGTRRNA